MTEDRESVDPTTEAAVGSFTAAMLWGIIVATASSIFIGGPVLIYFNLRPSSVAPAKGEAETGKPAKARP